MHEQSIENLIKIELSDDDQKIALDFINYLHENNFDFIRDKGYWKDKIYFIINYNDQCICCIAINDPDEKENRWTVWSDDIDSNYLDDPSIENDLKETAWQKVDHCGHCGSCRGGRKKIIFGKVFNEVCGCTFRFDNPNENDLKFMKKMVEIRKKEISEKV